MGRAAADAVARGQWRRWQWPAGSGAGGNKKGGARWCASPWIPEVPTRKRSPSAALASWYSCGERTDRREEQPSGAEWSGIGVEQGRSRGAEEFGVMRKRNSTQRGKRLEELQGASENKALLRCGGRGRW